MNTIPQIGALVLTNQAKPLTEEINNFISLAHEILRLQGKINITQDRLQVKLKIKFKLGHYFKVELLLIWDLSYSGVSAVGTFNNRDL